MATVIHHEQREQQVMAWALALVEQHRDRLGLEKRWRIAVKTISNENKECAGLIEWIPDTYEAILSVRCDLPYTLICWETVHELIELSKYRSGTIVAQFASHCKKYNMSASAELFMQQYRIARNQEIEQEVERYLGRSRPFAC